MPDQPSPAWGRKKVICDHPFSNQVIFTSGYMSESIFQILSKACLGYCRPELIVLLAVVTAKAEA